MLPKFTTLIVAALAALGAAEHPPITKHLSKALTRYAWFASAAYSDNCTIPPYGTTAEFYWKHEATDSQATLFRDDVEREFIVAFRGTTNVKDFLTDLNKNLVSCEPALGPDCVGCMCHAGFVGQCVGMWDQAWPKLRYLLRRDRFKLTITGHSMGAAGAAMFATAISAKGAWHPSVFTFGQPRTGNQAFADFVDKQFSPYTPGNGIKQYGWMFRATNKNDGVCQVPWHRDHRYVHHSTEIWMPMKGDEALLCEGQDTTGCNRAHRGIPLNRAHFEYFGVSTGSPNAKEAGCRGGTPGSPRDPHHPGKPPARGPPSFLEHGMEVDAEFYDDDLEVDLDPEYVGDDGPWNGPLGVPNLDE